MKITEERITEGEDEVIIRYHKLTPIVTEIIRHARAQTGYIVGRDAEKQRLLSPYQILYFEYVDNTVFAYTAEDTVRIDQSLSELESSYSRIGMFRCSKSFVINVNMIKELSGSVGNRIDCTLSNGEHIIISRSYAKQFRQLLREGGRRNDD